MKKVYQFFMTALSLSVLGQTLFEREESLQNHPTHFTAYRPFALPNFVRKRRVFYKQFETRFSKTSKIKSIGILSTRSTTKTSLSLFFHFQKQLIENLDTKPL
jgi:hypothetical protein